MRESLLSILIPVYNAEKTLTKCIESIISQENDLFEVIIVNDGSKDDSFKILQRYRHINNFTIINQENHGVANTRQKLIENAKGKYILFCDADDYFEPNAIHIIVETIRDKNCLQNYKGAVDLFVFGYNLIREDRIRTVKYRRLKPGIYLKAQYAKFHINGLDDLYYSVLWNKCFRRDLFFCPTELHFERLIEDVIFNIDYIDRCKFICVADAVIYNYCQIGESITRSNKKDTGADIIAALNVYGVLKQKILKTYPDYIVNINKYICFKLFSLSSRAYAIHDYKVNDSIKCYLAEYKKQLGIHYLYIRIKLHVSNIKNMAKERIRKLI